MEPGSLTGFRLPRHQGTGSVRFARLLHKSLPPSWLRALFPTRCAPSFNQAPRTSSLAKSDIHDTTTQSGEAPQHRIILRETETVSPLGVQHCNPIIVRGVARHKNVASLKEQDETPPLASPRLHPVVAEKDRILQFPVPGDADRASDPPGGPALYRTSRRVEPPEPAPTPPSAGCA
jgi:hypothetical protein